MTANSDKTGDKSELTPKQEKAIAALLGAVTIQQAAIRADISESTLLRWLKLPVFASAYREARHHLVIQAVGHLQRACTGAVSVLCSVAADKTAPSSSRVSAARAILDTAMRASEIEDLAARMEELEGRLDAEDAKTRATKTK
jgi:hypothetical protein